MPPISPDTFLDRFRADVASSAEGHDAVARRVAAILRQLGWASASDEPPERVAARVPMIFDACARGHRDLPTLYRDLAEHLRGHAHVLDGSGTPTAAWLPMAVSLVERYTNAGSSRG